MSFMGMFITLVLNAESALSHALALQHGNRPLGFVIVRKGFFHAMPAVNGLIVEHSFPGGDCALTVYGWILRIGRQRGFKIVHFALEIARLSRGLGHGRQCMRVPGVDGQDFHAVFYNLIPLLIGQGFFYRAAGSPFF